MSTQKNDLIRPIYNNITNLVQWIKPGLLAYRIGLIRKAFEQPAIGIQKAHDELIEEFVLYEGEGAELKRKVVATSNGGLTFDFGDNTAECEKRYVELMSGTTEIDFKPLTTKDLELIETRDRIENLKDAPPVDFTILSNIIVET